MSPRWQKAWRYRDAEIKVASLKACKHISKLAEIMEIPTYRDTEISRCEDIEIGRYHITDTDTDTKLGDMRYRCTERRKYKYRDTKISEEYPRPPQDGP